MSNGSDDDRVAVFSEGFAVPITGLLALLFALMAGVTAATALSGSLTDAAFPIIFALASLFCFRLRQRSLAARTDADG